MSPLEGLFLGLLQGLTEFLPISSSGHLILAQRLFGVEADLFFDVMLHVGTLFAVCLFYRKQIWQIIKNPLKSRLLFHLVIATALTLPIAGVVKVFFPQILDGRFLAIGFALTVVLLVVSHFFSKENGEIRWWQALVCGAVQGVAVLPGLSRSGSTVSALKLCGANGEEAGEFSFLLSVPVIVASAVVEGVEVATSGVAVNWLATVIGTVSAFLSGYCAVGFVTRMLKKSSWVWFALYLAIPLLLSLIIL